MSLVSLAEIDLGFKIDFEKKKSSCFLCWI